MSEALAWLAIWSMILWIIGMLRTPVRDQPDFKLLFLPGLVADTVIRIPLCLLTLTPIERISPLAPGRVFLETGPSRLGGLAEPIVVTLRVLLTLTLFYFMLCNYPRFLDSGFAVPRLDPLHLLQDGLDGASWGEYRAHVLQLPRLLELPSPGSMLLLYALATTAVATAFTHREFGAALAVLLLLTFFSVALTWLGVKFGFLSRGWFLQWRYVPPVWSTFSLVTTLSAVGLIYLALFRGFRRPLLRVVSASRRRSSSRSSPP